MERDYQVTTNPMTWGLVSGVIFFYDHRAKSNGLYPLKIRITYKHERTYYNTGYSLKVDQWKGFNAGRGDLKEIRIAIQDQMEIIGEHVKEMNKEGNFSFDLLAAKLGRGKKNDVFAVFEARIKDIKDKGGAGNAMIYGCALNSLKCFTGGKELPFERITKTWLESYDAAMIKSGNTTATRSMYMRCLRAVINSAGKIAPFGKDKGKFQIKSGGGRKLALSKEQINTLMKHEVVPGSTTDKMRDLFYFSYLTNGLNVKDMILLKWTDIQNNEIYFIRAKTARMNAKETEIIAPILPQTKRIIDKWGNRESKYIFGYINGNTSPQSERTTSQNVTRLMNKHLKIIAKATGLPHISTYNARFSFATNLLQSGVPIEYISSQLGHSKIETTKIYCGEYNPEDRMKYNKELIEE